MTPRWQEELLGPLPDPPVDPDADARALASTLRLRILRLCLDEPRSNREIAAALGRNPGSTLHHVRTLVDRGFLAPLPVRRGVRGSREVPYLATGRSWRTPVAPGDPSLVRTFVDEIGEARPDDVAVVRLGLTLTPAARAELDQRVSALLQEYADRAPDPGGEPVAVFYASYDDAQRRRLA
ncbi:winged helix-turn-helix domain-containing protein [Luteimicrobium subarcticum]|uniref:Helix-turn-helix protein n=1 Tax=Luteimicrobium subarcticum TaxID=620910 RepID=A0A2M8WV08_9MICO|nr:winged helix-turn-helix domain-containing protein [Luteimicrobium subarcticum]PJI94772.1 helix-turn-helix protein [Luteimicrobium subarcticum]